MAGDMARTVIELMFVAGEGALGEGASMFGGVGLLFLVDVADEVATWVWHFCEDICVRFF